MKLYKYLRPELVTVLADRRLRFTQPVYFNDPFELSPSIGALVAERDESSFIDQLISEMTGDSEVFASRFQKALEEHAGAMLDQLPPDVRAMITPELGLAMVEPELRPLIGSFLKQATVSLGDRWRPETREKVGRMIGILSLSEQCDNLLMWAHYAQSHEGFVIGFDSEHAFFDQRKHDRDMIRKLERVRYSKERPAAVLLNPSLSEAEQADMFAANFFLTKSEEWAYEREWRMLRAIEEASAQMGEVCLFEFPEDAVTDIIIGCQASETTSAALLAQRDAGRYANANWARATVHPTAFAVSVEPIGENREGEESAGS